MASYWISLKDLPEAGEEYLVQDQEVWDDPIREFRLPYVITESFLTRVHVSPQDKGYLIKGQFSGAIELPCDRCAEPSGLSVADGFSIFEEADPDLSEEDNLGPRFLLFEEGTWFLDLAGVLWEQFVLNIPFKYLCSDSCLGVCGSCGSNLNTDICQCEQEEGDPRLAVFRRLKVE